MKNQPKDKKATPRLKYPIILLGLYLVSTPAPDARIRSQRLGQAPEIVLTKQENAPLQIISVQTQSLTFTMPHLNPVIMNVSAKPIIAYAIRYDVITDRSSTNGLELSIADLPKSVLQPGQSIQIDIGGGENHSDGIKKIIVSVDFVEFDDASTWGRDTRKSAERLAGFRTGARAAAEHLLQILNERGVQVLVKDLDAEPLGIVPPPANRSDEWLDGFRAGIGHMQGRVEQAYRDDGVSGIEPALKRPVSALKRQRLQ